MNTILISACLLGVSCRYDGKSCPNEKALLLKEKYNLIPVCAEILGGLPTPRLPCEIRDGRVIRSDSADITSQYVKGAQEVLRLAKAFNCCIAVLKERSPSCGKGKIYDGNFSGTVTVGDGITASLLTENNIKIYGESEIDLLLRD